MTFTKQKCKCIVRQRHIEETGVALAQQDSSPSISRSDGTLWRMHKPLDFYEYLVHKRLILLILCQLRLVMWPGAYGFMAPLKELTITITHKYLLWFPAQQNAWTNQSIIYGKKALFHSCSLTGKIFSISWSGRWFMCRKEFPNASPGYSRFITHSAFEPNHDASYKGWFCIHTLMMPIQRVAGI